MTSLPRIILCPCGQFFRRSMPVGRVLKPDIPRKYLLRCPRCEREYFIWEDGLRFFNLHGFYRTEEITEAVAPKLNALKEKFESPLYRPPCLKGGD